MNLGEFYTYINAMIAKEVEGNAFNPVVFNAVIKETNLESFRAEFDFLEQQAKAQGVPLYKLLFSGSPLRIFTETHTTTGSSIITLSAITPSFEYFIACTAIYNNLYVNVDLVDLAEANYRRAKLDGMSLYEQPIISLFKDKLRILPTDVNQGIELIYLRLPEAPFYDYYIDENTSKAYYLLPGYHAIGDGTIFQIYTDNDIAVVGMDNCTLPNNITNATTYDSQSVEFEWKENYHPELIKKILFKAGVPIRDEFVIQTAKA